LEQSRQAALAERATLVGTTIPQGKELAAHIKNADGPASDLDDFALAGRYLADSSYNIFGHRLISVNHNFDEGGTATP
jgi:hypothetical protein